MMVPDVSQLFVFFMLIGANFLAQLFSCNLQNLLVNNMLAKHVLGFMTLVLSVVLVSGDSTATPTSQLAASVFLYVLFLMASRCQRWMLSIVVGLLFALYVMQMYAKQAEKADDEATTERLRLAKIGVTAVILVLLPIGFVMYALTKRQEYGPGWRLSTFVLGIAKCKFNGDGPGAAAVAR